MFELELGIKVVLTLATDLLEYCEFYLITTFITKEN